jgi:XTP/dITP diphosphohydrolase
VLGELGAIENSIQREAAFYCALVLAKAGQVIWTTESVLEGQITTMPIGDAGFGFDPIFFVPELRKTLAQLTAEEKNRISARGQALSELKRFLSTQ